MEPEGNGRKSSGITISREIRAGDLLQVIGMLVAGFAVWSSMDTRVTKVEERQLAQSARIEQVAGDIRDNYRQVKDDVKEIGGAVRTIDQRISRKGL